MGCTSSSLHPAVPDKRLLSAYYPAVNPGEVDGKVPQVPRCLSDGFVRLSSRLPSSKLMETWPRVGGSSGPRFGLLSETDTDLDHKPPFAEKSVCQFDGLADPANYGLGFTCRKGEKYSPSPNQDSWLLMDIDGNLSMYAVFDGHGIHGHDVSNFVKDTLPTLIMQDSRIGTAMMPLMLVDTFKQMQTQLEVATHAARLDASLSGTTATVVIHDHAQQKLTVAHVGDSGACIGRQYRKRGFRELEVVELTRDHKPEDGRERARIERAGGRVVTAGGCKSRVFGKDSSQPGLNMSRSLGDLEGHQRAGISAEPAVWEHRLTKEDQLLLLCSDGIWEQVTPSEAVGVFRGVVAGVVRPGCGPGLKHRAPPGAMTTTQKLATLARDRWREQSSYVDDITVLAVLLQQRRRTSRSRAASGHSGL